MPRPIRYARNNILTVCARLRLRATATPATIGGLPVDIGLMWIIRIAYWRARGGFPGHRSCNRVANNKRREHLSTGYNLTTEVLSYPNYVFISWSASSRWRQTAGKSGAAIL